jgi:uncharacterized membrane protein YGL010W
MFPYSAVVSPRLERLLAEYGESHRHWINVAIHWIFEPLLIWALLALFRPFPIPALLAWMPGLNGMTALVFCLLAYFASLSMRLTIILAFLAVIFCAIVAVIEANIAMPVWQLALPLFAMSWIALFTGHRIEGNTPSVFRNPHMIFIGPVWLLTQTILVGKKWPIDEI